MPAGRHRTGTSGGTARMRKKLADIMMTSEVDKVKQAWAQTEAAAERGPVPPGTYVCRVESAEFFAARTGTHGIKLVFAIVEPVEHEDSRLWHDLWLTPAALPVTKRDLAKIGIR